ncbi:hypothetical protein IWQ61_009013 [Dispira simplex]|nr:hypothetical protein IWQ61_009013 [Dispira simplex]
MTSQPLYLSTSSNTNIYTTQCEGLTLKDSDKQCTNEIDQEVEKRMISNQSDLIEKVTRVLSIWKYSSIAEDFEALEEVVNPDTNSLHQRLY